MRVAVLTSTNQRHLYFAARIAERFEVPLVVTERKEFHPDRVHRDEQEEEILRQWFDLRNRMEEDFFGDAARRFVESHGDRILELEPKAVNEPENIQRLVDSGVGAAAVFGTSLLRPPLIEALEGRLVNCHLGLSPYYRGSGTNFWPFYNRELEYVGVTVHWIDTGVDSGPILHQGRPEIAADDNPHSIGCKTIQVGADLVCRALAEVEAGDVRAVPQRKGEGRLYRRKDFAAEHVKRVLADLDEGLIARYAASPVDVEIVP